MDNCDRIEPSSAATSLRRLGTPPMDRISVVSDVSGDVNEFRFAGGESMQSSPEPGADVSDKQYDSNEETFSDSSRLSTEEATNERRPRHLLGRCKVCGAKATGFHYGVNTCEACKGFFRRSLVRKEEYVCVASDSRCNILPRKRNTCASCRYQKCLLVGMGLQSVKMGRYTYEKRTHDILEQRHSKRQKVEQQQQFDVQDFINDILRAQDLSCPNTIRAENCIHRLQEQAVLDATTLLPSGECISVPLAEFLRVYQTTGVQLDNRLNLVNKWMVVLEQGIRSVISFAKFIPGFKSLTITDQMSLIKHSMCEIWIVSRHKAFHKELAFFTEYNGFTFDLVRALGEDFGQQVLQAGRRLQTMQLTEEETFLLKAFVLFFTDRCELQEPDKVTLIHERILQALLFMLEKNHPSERHLLGRLCSVFIQMRNVTDFYHKYNSELRVVSSSGAVNFPPLFLEVISLS